MEYITTKEASEKWGISPTRITILANQGRIAGARRAGKYWLIPIDAEKPMDKRMNRGDSAEADAGIFSFPMYPYRPDWRRGMDVNLSAEERLLLTAENAILECRYADAYALLKHLLDAPCGVGVEVCALWSAAVCAIALNRVNDFSGIYLRLQVLLTGDFPHRDDYAITLDTLKIYTEPIGTIAETKSFNTDVSYQCLPMVCVQISYSHLVRETIRVGSADATMLELMLHFLENTEAVIVTELMHCYLMGIYFCRQKLPEAEKHAKELVRLAYKHNHFFALTSYYHYYVPLLSPILEQYPADFQEKLHALHEEYLQNFRAFLASYSSDCVFAKLTDKDYVYIGAIFQDLPNRVIAEKLGVSEQTIGRNIKNMCAELGVSNKKELKEYLRSYI